MTGRWSEYYAATKDGRAHVRLTDLLDELEVREDLPRLGIDLGCGAGRDSVELLRRGWEVLAVDAEEEGLEILRAKSGTGLLTTRCVRFEEMGGLPRATLINSTVSLPFCSPSHFPILWSTIVEAIQPGGCLRAELFGVNHEWSDNPHMTFVSREMVETLLEPFERVTIDEKDEATTTVEGVPTREHYFSIVAWKGER